jgi:hypothetical protein
MRTFLGRGKLGLLGLLLAFVPGAQYLPTRDARGRRRARAIMERVGRALIRERKAAAM